MNTIGRIRGSELLVNAVAVAVAVPVFLLFFKVIWRVQVPEDVNVLWLVLFAVGLLVAHEGIHGAAALLFLGRGKVSFGVGRLVVYCRVHGVLTRNKYIVYALAPAGVLGIAGLGLYYSSHTAEGRFFAALLCLGGVGSGGGDYWLVARALRYPASSLLLDHGPEVEVFAAPDR